MSGIFQHCVGMMLSDISRSRSRKRTVEHTCLTETAAADTASLDLQYHTVLGGFDIREPRGFSG